MVSTDMTSAPPLREGVPSAPSVAPASVDVTREDLELEKLTLEVAELKRPQWLRASVLIPAAVAVVSTATVWVQWSTSSWKADKAAYELTIATAQQDSVARARKGFEDRIAALRLDSLRLTANNARLQQSIDVVTTAERQALTQGNGTALSATPLGPSGVSGTGAASARSDAIAGLFADSPGARGRAYDILIQRYATDPDLVPALIAHANTRRAQWSDRTVQNGIYNTLVVLSHLGRAQVAPHAPAIRAFAASVRDLGPKIRERSEVVLTRLPA